MTSDKTNRSQPLDGKLQASDEEIPRPIVLAIQQSPPGSFIFIESNTPTERKRFSEKIKECGFNQPIHYVDAYNDLPKNPPLYRTIPEFIAQRGIKEDSPILIIDGLDKTLGDKKHAKEWLETFNLGREALASIKVCFVFLLPTFCVELIRRYAPDVWDWRMFHFELPSKETGTVESSSRFDMSSDIPVGDNPEKRRSRITVLRKIMDDELERHGSVEAIWRTILLPLAKELRHSGEYKESLGALKKAENWIKSRPNSEEASDYYNELGEINYTLGEIESSESLFRRALEIDEELFGGNHPNVAIRVNNIGLVLQDKGELDEALRYYKRALAIDEEVFGENHPNVARDVNNIGMALQDKGDLDEALRYLKRALTIGEEVLGKSHPNVAIAVNNIGLALRNKGDLDEALRFLKRALAIDEEVFGENHPNVAIRVNNIGGVLQDKGDLDEALRYLKRALAIDEEVFGENHPNVAIDVNNIGMVLKDKGDLAGAKEHLKRAFLICLNTYGRENPRTQTVYKNYLNCGGKPEDLD